MKILTVYNDYGTTPERKRKNTYGGVGYYRIIKPTEQLKGHEVRVIGREIAAYGDTLADQWANVFKDYDVFRTCYLEDDRAAAAMYFMRDRYKKKVIIDIDDNYLDVQPSNDLYEKFKAGTRARAMLSTVISFADALTVSTEPLKQRISEHLKEVHGIDKPIFVLPNCNDVSDWQHEPIKLPSDRFVIGYSGSTSHKDDFKMVLPAIREIMKKHKHVWFELLGVLTMDQYAGMLDGFTDDMLNRMALVGSTGTFKEYPKWLAERPWHVGIAPLEDNMFTRSKSHIKWMEYSMYKIPVLASRVYPYYMDLQGKETIRDGETGLLLKPNEWFDALDDMVQNYDKQKVMGENAFKFIKEQWQYKDAGIDHLWDQILAHTV